LQELRYQGDRERGENGGVQDIADAAPEEGDERRDQDCWKWGPVEIIPLLVENEIGDIFGREAERELAVEKRIGQEVEVCGAGDRPALYP